VDTRGKGFDQAFDHGLAPQVCLLLKGGH
jgi:hypothetical protein